jgi:hypothetical protein
VTASAREVAIVERRVSLMIAALVAALLVVLFSIPHYAFLRHWVAVHTGTVNEPGPYYGFWSGFGSDLTEFGIIGVISTGVYQLVRKYNCHYPGCWRVGTHSAADGQFLLCYHHHPDFEGKKPTADMIRRLHEQNVSLQTGLQRRMDEIHRRIEALHPEPATDATDAPKADT